MPTAPQNLNYMNFINTGVMFNVTLTWSRPDPPNGIITQYNVSGTLLMVNIFNNNCHRYLMLIQTYKEEILIFRKQTSIVVLSHLIHGLI